MTSGKDREKEHYNKMITKKSMKQYIHYFWTGPIKKISLKNLAIIQKKRFWCVLSFVSLFHIQSKAMMENVLRIGQLFSHFRRNT